MRLLHGDLALVSARPVAAGGRHQRTARACQTAQDWRVRAGDAPTCRIRYGAPKWARTVNALACSIRPPPGAIAAPRAGHPPHHHSRRFWTPTTIQTVPAMSVPSSPRLWARFGRYGPLRQTLESRAIWEVHACIARATAVHGELEGRHQRIVRSDCARQLRRACFGDALTDRDRPLAPKSARTVARAARR